ncbi:hypothetical protein, partial [Mesorhizobium sp.]|uniref:hypothetical protein n=1 Tax=Mesorhizobium sp. TaxID=1871066 RepID=UPI0025B90505
MDEPGLFSAKLQFFPRFQKAQPVGCLLRIRFCTPTNGWGAKAVFRFGYQASCVDAPVDARGFSNV